MRKTSEISIISGTILDFFVFFIYGADETHAQFPDLFVNETNSLGNGEQESEEDSMEVMIPEKGIFGRIEPNSTGTD